MKRRKIFMSVIVGLLIVISIATVVFYFILADEKPWMAFYVACCGGVLIVNLLFSLFLVHKNFKNKG